MLRCLPLILVFARLLWSAGACEVVLTHSELAAVDRARAVEMFAPGGSGGGFGHTVSSAAGDVNGDGFDDFVIAAPNEGMLAGAVYVVFGRRAKEWAKFDLSTASSSSWVKISDSTSRYFGGYRTAFGDFNGDGLGDLLFGSYDGGIVRCVFGHNGTWDTVDLAFTTFAGFNILESSSSQKYVGNAGDMNGDGIEDIAIAIESTLHVVFGAPGATRAAFLISSLNGTNGFSVVDHTLNLGFGYVFGAAGDVNGDGLADLAFGTKTNGYAFVLFARNVVAMPWPASLNITEIDGTNGFIAEGIASGFHLGYTVVGAGDVNGDGFDDVFIGTESGNAGAWVVFGHPVPWTSPLNVSEIDGSGGFHFKSSASGEYWGVSGGAAGDVNGDGFDDVVIGGSSSLSFNGSMMTGAAVILLGHGGMWNAELFSTDTVGSVGFFIDGPDANSQFGFSARGVGDVNGDGLADFIVGAQGYESSSGYAVLVFGTADDHCAVCSNTTDECLVCDNGFFLNGTICENAATELVSSSFTSSAGTVVVIETGGGGSVSEVAEEIAQLLGVDVGQISVVEITPGIFEVTVINEEVAQQLVTLIEQCIEQEGA